MGALALAREAESTPSLWLSLFPWGGMTQTEPTRHRLMGGGCCWQRWQHPRLASPVTPLLPASLPARGAPVCTAPQLGGGAEATRQLLPRFPQELPGFISESQAASSVIQPPRGSSLPAVTPPVAFLLAAPLCLPHFQANWKPNYGLEVSPLSQNPHSSWKGLTWSSQRAGEWGGKKGVTFLPLS